MVPTTDWSLVYQQVTPIKLFHWYLLKFCDVCFEVTIELYNVWSHEDVHDLGCWHRCSIQEQCIEAVKYLVVEIGVLVMLFSQYA